MVKPEHPADYQPKRLKGPGKHLMKAPRRFHVGAAAAVGLCVLALAGATEFSAAFLMEQDSVDNKFEMGNVAPEIVEQFEPENKVKKDVAIKNSGNTPVYIRALVVITWQDTNGNTILSTLPEAGEGKDYLITGKEEGWLLGGDGYYYYTQPVQPGQSTAELVQSLTDQNGDTTRQLSVDVIAQAVQASPTQAVTEVFRGVSFAADGITLMPPASGEVSP